MATSNPLTADQIRRMEENKRRALALRAQKQAQHTAGRENSCSNAASRNTNTLLPQKQNVIQRMSSTGRNEQSFTHQKPAQTHNVGRFGNTTTSGKQNEPAGRMSSTGQNEQPYTHQNTSGSTSSKVAQTYDNVGRFGNTTSGKQNVPAVRSPVAGNQLGSSTTETTRFYSSSKSNKPPLGNNTGKTQNSGAAFFKPKGTNYANVNKPSSAGFSNNNQKSSSTNFAARKEGKLLPRFGEGGTGTCVLLSRERFEVQVGYCAPLIEVFKQMPTKYYDMQTRVWSFELKDYEKLMERVQKAQLPVQLSPLPKSVLTTFKNQLKGKMTEELDRRVPEADLSRVEPKLVNTLLPFQRKGVNFAIWRNGRVLIADDMGLGKTMQALCVAAYYRQEWPLLIVTPSSLRLTWAEAFHRWLPSVDPQAVTVMLTGKDNPRSGLVTITRWAFHRWLPSVDPQAITVMLTGKDNPKSGQVTITSYDLMVRCSQQIRARGYRVIIMDESHVLKNFKTARTKAALPLLKAASRVILLSGTPALSRPSELFTQLSAVEPRLFSSFHEFGVRYCEGKQTAFCWDYSGSCNMKELQLVLEERVMIRRLKKDVLSQLPSKQRQVVVMEPGVVNMKSFQAAATEMTKKHKNNAEQRGALLQYFNETALVKIPHIKDYVLDLLESDRKFLVFAHHQIVLDSLGDVLDKKGYGYIRIDGKTPSDVRQQLCDRYQTQDSCQVALLSITAASTGLTLTAASLVVFAELFWNPGFLVQAEDRAHRIGQQDCVNVHYLVARGTADDYIWPLVQGKLDVLSKAGLTKDDFSTADTTSFRDPKQETILSYLERSFSCDDPEDDLALLEAMEDYGVQEGHSKDTSTGVTAKQSDTGVPTKGSARYTYTGRGPEQATMDKFVVQQPDAKEQGTTEDDGKVMGHHDCGESDAFGPDNDVMDEVYLDDPLWLDDLGEDDFDQVDLLEPESKRQRMA
ncbi:SWI/SNF- matrix-associated actin-dependent regulator of chromatin sub A-like protein 1 [Branchiostoma belcheri]|nr:SWI/SNF- matrix-associated actin-dependent regulator of chromatin sub A-like protein 1 [Branchiostoma belcheri]